MGKITIIANNFIENASGSIRDDGAQIFNQSGNKFVQNGNKGVNYDKNKDRKAPTNIRITKVEGPFDDKGKLIDKIILDTSYTFKATPTRKPTITELKLLKWAVKLDDTAKEIILGAANYNKLEDDTISIFLRLKHDFKKAKVYAFYQKADDKASVDIKINDVFHPYIIAQSRHRKGMNEEGTGTHHDMMSKDMTDDEIIELNPDAKKWIDIVNKEGYKGIQKLAVEMEDLITDFSKGKLEDVNLKLYRKFIGNIEGDFSDKVLTKATKDHAHSKTFFNRIKENMKIQLNLNSNFVYEEKLMPCLLKIKSIGRLEDDELKSILDKIKNKKASVSELQKLKKHNETDKYRIDIPSPSYPDNYGGLGISINDTWGYDITLINFKQDIQRRSYSAELDIEIFDHYGLNSDDIDPNINGGFFDSASFEGFLCWFILQHKCGYKPFYTILKMKHKIQNEPY